jgi:hypothetical protein
MSAKECSWDVGERHGLSFDQRSVLFILGLSLRQYYEPFLQSDWDERIRGSLQKLSELSPETR